MNPELKRNLQSLVPYEATLEMDKTQRAQYYAGRYSEEVMRASGFHPGEDPADYFKRLRDLYPRKAQRACIDGLWYARIAGVTGNEILTLYPKGVYPPLVEEYFPRELNPDAVQYRDGESPVESIRITMRKDKAHEVMRFCNVASYQVSEFGRELAAALREKFKSALLGKVSDTEIPAELFFRVKLKQLEAQMQRTLQGGIVFDAKVDRMLSNTITSAEFYTDVSAQAFRDLSAALSGPYNPGDGLAYYLLAKSSMDELMIWPQIDVHIAQAANAQFGLA